MEVNISKFKDYEKIDFEVEVVTPLFMGGAEKEKAEIRGSSIKGLLRFWWRIANGNNYKSIKEMYKAESKIFGNTDNSSNFKIKIKSINNQPKSTNLPTGKTFNVKGHNLGIIDYLAFGSLRDFKNYIKQYYPEGTKFAISFTFYDKNAKKEVLQAFWLLEKYGGLGAKSRNGFGCFKIINGDEKLNDVKLKKEIYNNAEPKDFLIFSKEVKNFKLPNSSSNSKNYNSWVDALSDAGLVYRKARLALEPRHVYHRRAKIGLPIIAFKEPISDKYKKEYKEGRLAKPLFLHVSKIKETEYQSSILVVPYTFNGNFDKKFWEDFFKNFPS